jgi:uncharacterized protein with von Willebrand factor type A (vWA) domain
LKDAAIALNRTIVARYPADVLRVVTISAYATEIDRHGLTDLSSQESVLGTNVHAALLLAHEILSTQNESLRRILLLAGSQPSAHLERGRSYFARPTTPITMRQTVAAAQRCVADGFPVTLFSVGDTPDRYAKAFHDRLAAEAGAEVVEANPTRLADTVIEVYERGRLASGT